MRIADLWFSALWVLLVPTCRSLALATANSNGLFGIPSGGSTSTKTRVQATSIDASSAEAPSSVSSAAFSSSEVCPLLLDSMELNRIE
jgi:hypothetical protein